MISLVFTNDKMKKAKNERVKKILTLSGGSLGREKKSYVRGQVVKKELKFSEAERVELSSGLYPGEEEKLTPFRDIKLEPVANPEIYLEIIDKAGNLVYQSVFYGDKNGFFKHEIEQKLKNGRYESRFFTQAEVNLFHFTETKIINDEHFILTGKSKLTILAENSNAIITTSDIDQTYLETPLDSIKGKVLTLFETPAEKKQISGMSELYQSLRKNTSGYLSFISASPHFYRRSFFAKFRQDRIESESLHLKYLKGTIQELASKFKDTFSSPSDFFKSGWEAKLHELKVSSGKYYRSLFDQISYKLSILLHNRIYHPTNSREILLGDDTESDYLIYSLYQLIITGKLQGLQLEQFLDSLEFNGKKAVTNRSAKMIKEYAAECLKQHGEVNPVISVLINHTDHNQSQKKLYANVQKVLPEIRISTLKNFKLFVLADGALGFGAILHSQGILDAVSVFNIGKKITTDERMDLSRISELFTNLDFLDLGGKTRKLLEKTLKHAMIHL